MTKLITTKRRENKADARKTYIQTFIMVPSVLLGMVSLIVGYGGIIFTFMADKLTGTTLLDSTGLLFFGALLGWGHARYQHRLFLLYPEYYASHFQLLTKGGRKKRRKKEPGQNLTQHPKPQPLLHYGVYLAGAGALVASIIFPIATSRLNVYAAIFLPFAGYFNGKFLVWRRRLKKM